MSGYSGMTKKQLIKELEERDEKIKLLTDGKSMLITVIHT